jgi:hypothetical protein
MVIAPPVQELQPPIHYKKISNFVDYLLNCFDPKSHPKSSYPKTDPKSPDPKRFRLPKLFNKLIWGFLFLFFCCKKDKTRNNIILIREIYFLLVDNIQTNH